ncbi:hypothetical protein I316_01181 [Kwoniella heveanensis BCC8398]|uniref:Chromatin modification-related protein EAF6 n=1 Tax=Kwoniella heveanensis BCC8398 TaxID=1296120 RepID=A0A1B9H1X2_9TREE|nr:hypothetical protein I316_01181 [Kwoniella heveanensis BCC8398]
MSQSGPPADAKQAQAAALQELEAAQRRKRAIDTTLANLEHSIYAFEGSYLDETAASGGNIIKGFDNYLKPPTGNVNKKKFETTEADRLFSTSSGTYQQSIAAKQQYDAQVLAARQLQAQIYRSSDAPSISTPNSFSNINGNSNNPSAKRTSSGHSKSNVNANTVAGPGSLDGLASGAASSPAGSAPDTAGAGGGPTKKKHGRPSSSTHRD